ncbi:MAG: ATP-binding cassette domain-containing protein [Clostridia bacterium]|jgi:tungstate transport system ATP-binding protein|nr:ATP-binding cassette domain-containing protein [Clostridia bacterium]MDD4146556.1 ATP-binding cassette domain-containing protein [Clostridia bacterium]MDD4666089.1 ATP-binding cassette domain-containing protein [Clostridia bacterium]
MLELKKISHCYNKQWVLKEISFQFKPGLIYGIIGPNGAGKSTLLRILTGIERAKEGQVFWDGQELAASIKEMTCMWQKPYLFQRKVKDNLLYGLKVRGWSKDKREERLLYILKKFHLEEYALRDAVSLSGGEGARVALARAVAPQPRLLVLDEPAANLDPFHTAYLESALREISREEGITVIMVTHDLFQAKRVADQTLFLAEGVLEEYGRTEDLFTRPRSEKTRKFISGEL